MHASLSTLQDGRLFLIGGRLSPMKLCTQMVAVEMNYGKKKMKDGETLVCMNCGQDGDNSENMNCAKEADNGAYVNQVNVEELCMNSAKMNISLKNKPAMNCPSEGNENSEDIEIIAKSDDKKVNLKCDVDNKSVINECENSKAVKITVIDQSGVLPSPRWRHTAVVHRQKGNFLLLNIFG